MGWMVAVAGRWNLDTVRDVAREHFDCYFPMFRERVVVRGRKIWRDRWLFGRYFFVRGSEWVKSPVITSILMGSDMAPAQVCDEEIKRLRRREVKGYIPVEPKYRQGDRVRIVGGAFNGALGVVERAGPRMVICSNGMCVRIDERNLRRV